MKSSLVHLCIWSMTILSLASGELDPFAVPGEEQRPSEPEAVARVVTEEGRRTLEILRTEKIDSVKLVTGKFEEGFEIVKDRLAKHGIGARIMKGRKLDVNDPLYIKPASVPEGKPASVPEGGYYLKLEGATIEKFMKMLDQMAGSGWILYPDGSITYFENECSCRLPEDGIYCHDSQYEEGKPEVMDGVRVHGFTNSILDVNPSTLTPFTDPIH